MKRLAAILILAALAVPSTGNMAHYLAAKRREALTPTAVVGAPLKIIWKIGTNNTWITFPTRSGYSYSASVQWGDGNSTTMTGHNVGNSNLFATAGTYTSTIAGTVGAIYFNNTGSKTNFLGVLEWGDVGENGLGLQNAFYGCDYATNWSAPMSSSWAQVTDLGNAWRSAGIAYYGISFPDVTALVAVTNLSYVWFGQNGINGSPPIIVPEVNHMTNVESLAWAWRDCGIYTLTNPPAVYNLAKCKTITRAWQGNQVMRVAPNVNTLTNLIDMSASWAGNFSLTNASDVSACTQVTTLLETWSTCRKLVNCPLVSTLTNVITLNSTWYLCWVATNLPAVSNQTKNTSLYATWYRCEAESSFPEVNTQTNVTTLYQTWYGCTNGTYFPPVTGMSKVNNLYQTWRGDSRATTFPSVESQTNVTTMYQTWYLCTAMTNVPTLMSTATNLTDVRQAFDGNSNMYGTVVALWNPTNFPRLTNSTLYQYCFRGCTNLANYADIPADWK